MHQEQQRLRAEEAARQAAELAAAQKAAQVEAARQAIAIKVAAKLTLAMFSLMHPIFVQRYPRGADVAWVAEEIPRKNLPPLRVRGLREAMSSCRRQS